MPLHILQKAFVEAYSLKKYLPTILKPTKLIYERDNTAVYYSLDWLTGFLRWLFLLSLGIGLFNLLPLPIVDGGRMAQVFLHKLKGAEKGEKYYHKISLFFLLVLLLNLFYPWLVKLF